MVHNYYQIPGGEDTVAVNEKKQLELNGHKVIMYTRHNNELNNMTGLGKWVLIPATIFSWKTYRQVRSLILRAKIDIVHVHNTLPLISPSVYWAAFRLGKPVVQTLHNFRMLCPGGVLYRDGNICEECLEKGLGCALYHKCYRNSYLQTLAVVVTIKLHKWLGTYRRLYYISLTKFNRQMLLKLNRRRSVVDPDKVFVKPNFTFPASEDITDRDTYYLYAGRVEEMKGISILLDTFMADQGRTLLIAGNGSGLEKAEEAVSETGVGNIRFTGHIGHEELMRLIQAARAVIVPSVCYESFGMTVIEAYACHTPVIAVGFGNLKELVRDGETGVLFSWKEPNGLREALNRFERLDREALGRNAYKRFREEFTPDSTYKRLMEIYDRALEGQSVYRRGKTGKDNG